MKVNDKHFETIWLKKEDQSTVQIIDQRFLPFDFVIEDINNTEEMFIAIRDMHLRGAPLIGAAGALGMYLSTKDLNAEINSSFFADKARYLISARPTAVNLEYAVNRVYDAIRNSHTLDDAKRNSMNESFSIINEEREYCRQIGNFGVPLIEEIQKKKKGDTVNILTHCNAGWLACIDYGTPPLVLPTS